MEELLLFLLRLIVGMAIGLSGLVIIFFWWLV